MAQYPKSHNGQRKLGPLGLCMLGSLISLALPSAPSSGDWSSTVWGQRLFVSAAQAEPRRGSQAPAAPRPRVTPTPDTAPRPAAIDPESPLGSGLLSCDDAATVDPVSLPGAKGEIKLDRCYRGREHQVCSFRALLSEATFLFESFRKTVDASYPALGNLDEVCKIEPDTLETELQNTSDFTSRFKAFKVAYEARVNCATRIEQSFREVNLPDLNQAPAMLQSMIETFARDIKRVSDANGQLVEFGQSINSSQKALITIQKIYTTMCGRNADYGGAGPRGFESAGPSAPAKPLIPVRYYVVLDPVDGCAVIDKKPSAVSPLNTLGDKSGYDSLASANKALNAAPIKCKRAVIF